jgi:hypothetical protein
MARTRLPAGFISRQGQIEMRWAEEDRRREADRAFGRSRLLARLRRVLSAAGLGRRGKSMATRVPLAGFALAMDDIAGLACEGALRGLPALPRELAAAWRSEYYRRDCEDSFEPFMVRACSGQWLLEGGVRELMRLELLRARGEIAFGAIPIVGPAGAGEAAPACECMTGAWNITRA